MVAADEAAGPDECTSPATCGEVVYLGAVTRYVVDLDAGGELVVVQQNLTQSSMEALEVRGRRSGWRGIGRHNRGWTRQPMRGGPGPDRGRRGVMRRSDGRVARAGGGARAVAGGGRGAGRQLGGGVGRRGDESSQPMRAIGQGEGAAEPDRVGRLRRGRLERSGVRLGHPVRGRRPGAQVNVKYANTSDEMVTLMRQGGGTVYDGVSASGDASNRLIAGGDVAAINIDLFPDFPNVIEPLQAPRPQHGERRALRRAVHVRARTS